MQKAVIVSSFNPADPISQLSVIEKPIPKPAEGEVLIKVTARPVNPADVFSIMGVYPGFAPKQLPATPGLEGAGVVVDSNGTALANGTRAVVFFNTKEGDGSWQEYVAVPAAKVMPIPDSVTDETAGQFLVNPITVYGMLEELAAPAGEWLIQTAAGSVLGRQFITMAKKQGIKTINIVRRAEQAEELKALGADVVLCSEDGTDIAKEVQAVTGGKGAWGGIDAVGGSLTARVTGAIQNGGKLLIYGAMSGLQFTGSIVDCLFRDITVKGFWLNLYLAKPNVDAAKVFGEVVGMMASGELVPFSGESFSLDQVQEAVKKATSNARGGKVLLK